MEVLSKNSQETVKSCVFSTVEKVNRCFDAHLFVHELSFHDLSVDISLGFILPGSGFVSKFIIDLFCISLSKSLNSLDLKPLICRFNGVDLNESNESLLLFVVDL